MDSPLLAGAIAAASLPMVLWTAGAIYFDVVGASRVGALAAAAWIALWLLAFAFWPPLWQPFVLLLVAFAGIVTWWLSLRPSQDRNWAPHFARIASVTLNRDQLTINNVRNSEYRAPGDSTPHFETRTYRLSELRGIDALILTWGSPWMSHPMFVFDFGPGGRVCISIEVRYRVGQRFSLLRSLYRQQELMYVVSDERDAILRRIKYLAGHDLHLYRLGADDLLVRQFFLEYVARVNELASEPCWYHGLTTNCTTSVFAQGRGHIRWDWRMLFNGTLDKLMYDRRRLDQSMPFDRLKELSRINDVANRAPADGFGDYLRENLPGYSRADAAAPAVAESGA
jgi:hypothetical protein